VILQSYYLIY